MYTEGYFFPGHSVCCNHNNIKSKFKQNVNVGWWVFKGTFSINRLYCGMVDSNMSLRTRHKQIIIQAINVIQSST